MKNEDRLDKIATLVEAASETFGGFEPLIEAWVRHLLAAAEQQLGNKAVLDTFMAVLKLSEAHDAELRRQRDANGPDISTLTPAEKERFKMEATEQLIRQRPELAVAAARRLGWTVMAPTGSLA